jgi:hypothetical protein
MPLGEKVKKEKAKLGISKISPKERRALEIKKEYEERRALEAVRRAEEAHDRGIYETEMWRIRRLEGEE